MEINKDAQGQNLLAGTCHNNIFFCAVAVQTEKAPLRKENCLGHSAEVIYLLLVGNGEGIKPFSALKGIDTRTVIKSGTGMELMMGITGKWLEWSVWCEL